MSENPKAKKSNRVAARPRPDDQATVVSELNFQQAFPISLPESWPSEVSEGEGEGSDFRKSDSSNTIPTPHFSHNMPESGDTNVSIFDKPVAPQDSDFAFPNGSPSMEISSQDDADSAGIPLSDYQLDDEIIETGDDAQLTEDRSRHNQTQSSLAIADDELIPITESGATEFQEEVTRVAALEADVVHFDLAAEPVALPLQVSHIDETKRNVEIVEKSTSHSRFAATTASIEEPIVVVIESRNTSTREVSLTPSEFATAEQQILTNRIVHIPGKVLILDAVAIFRQSDPGISSRRRRRTA